MTGTVTRRQGVLGSLPHRRRSGGWLLRLALSAAEGLALGAVVLATCLPSWAAPLAPGPSENLNDPLGLPGQGVLKGRAGGQVAFADVPLRELANTGSISRETVTLAKVVGKYCASPQYRADLVLVYLWETGPKAKEVVPSVVAAELGLLDDNWDWLLGSGAHPRTVALSVAIVGGDSEAAREKVYQAIQKSGGGRRRFPTFIALAEDVAYQYKLAMGVREIPGELWGVDLVKALLGDPGTILPAALLFSGDTGAVMANRRDDPVDALAWVQYAFSPPVPPQAGDPADIPADCQDSWFRRQIARVVRAGIMEVTDTGFDPKGPVTDVEFMGWLERISLDRATGALRNYDPQEPKVLSRGRAITATVRFLYGEPSRADLAACPPPTRGSAAFEKPVGEEGGLPWERALEAVPGAGAADPSYRLYLAFALAKGLLYDEPDLRPDWDLTREVAAWLLDHALQPAPNVHTGIVVDAVDVPIEQDLRFGQGAIAVQGTAFAPGRAGEATAGGGNEADQLLPPATAISKRLPRTQDSFPLVQYVDYDRLAVSDSPEARWLVSRVGDNPLVVRATDAMSRKALISPEDAEAIRALNQQAGVLDDWKVAILIGRGARFLSPTTDVARDATLRVRFSVPMDVSTLTPGNVSLQDHGSGELARPGRVPAETACDATGRELQVSPETRLSPGATYDLIIGVGVRTKEGKPLTRRASLDGQAEPMPANAIRCWTFTTEGLLRLAVYVRNAPDGAKVYLQDRAEPEIMPASSPFEVRMPPGPLKVRIQYPDGREQKLSYPVTADGAVEVRAELPVPDRLRIEGVPASLHQGEAAAITVRAFDENGVALRLHKPVALTLEASGCQTSCGRWLTVADGQGSFTITSERPGLVEVKVISTDPVVPLDQDQVRLYCKYAAPASIRVWSPREPYVVPRPQRGKSDIVVMPRLRRWLALDPQNQVKVVSRRSGAAFAHISGSPGLPARNEFWVDSEGRLHFHGSAAGEVVDITHEYREGRAGVLVTGLSKDDVVRAQLERLVGELFRGYGCQIITSAELDVLWPDNDAQGHAFSASDVKVMQDVLGLNELVLAALSMVGDNIYDLTWTIWSADAAGPIPWSSRLASAPSLRFQVDRSRTPPVNPERVEEGLRRSLVPWLQAMGMKPDATLVSQSSPTPF